MRPTWSRDEKYVNFNSLSISIDAPIHSYQICCDDKFDFFFPNQSGTIYYNVDLLEFIQDGLEWPFDHVPFGDICGQENYIRLIELFFELRKFFGTIAHIQYSQILENNRISIIFW